MFYTIPLLADQSLNNNEKIFIGLLWVLSSHNTKEAFFQKEHIDLVGGRQIYNRTTQKLNDRNIISYQVKGYGTLKHRYFIIKDQNIITQLNNAPSRKQTDTPKKTSLKDRFVEKQQQQLELNFDVVFSQMKKLVTSFNYCFSDTELQTQAQNYLDKSQSYKFYKGKPTEAKIKAWLNQYLEQKKEKTPAASGSGDLEKRISFMNQLNEMSKRSDNEKKSDPIDADFEIIDEHKNAPA